MMVLLPETRWTYGIRLHDDGSVVAGLQTDYGAWHIVWCFWWSEFIDLRNTLPGAMTHWRDLARWRESPATQRG